MVFRLIDFVLVIFKLLVVKVVESSASQKSSFSIFPALKGLRMAYFTFFR